MGRIAFLVAATLIAGGFGIQQVYAQTDTTKSEKAEKQKEKKATTKQTDSQTNSGGAAPMSGFRPDMKSNY